MHFEILVEDSSGKKALDVLMPKILGDQHTFRVINYRGVGRIPKNLRSRADARQTPFCSINFPSYSGDMVIRLPDTPPIIQRR